MNAASRYIAGLFEAAVDRQLDLEQIRLFLASKGVARTPAQVSHDLDRVYCFHGYTGRHPAPAVLTMKQVDAPMGY
jgi:hypothetical protein